MAEPEENSTFNSSKSKCLLPSLLNENYIETLLNGLFYLQLYLDVTLTKV
jgi:hypothetical protein